MSINDFFGPGSNFDVRYIPDHQKLCEVIHSAKILKPDLKVVLTMGGFDLQHIGHYAYLEIAKNSGDILVVGLDSDEKLREKKGPDRPVNPLEERAMTLCHCRSVDLVTVKQLGEAKYNLIRVLQPDVLIATEKTYTLEQVDQLKKEFPNTSVKVLKSQATTSTSAKIRKLYMFLIDKIRGRVVKLYDDMRELIEIIESLGGEKNDKSK